MSDHDTDFYSALRDDDPVELYENAPCGYLSLVDGTIVKANRTFLSWTGYAPDELIGRRRLTDLLVVGDRIFYETHLAPLLRMQGRVREVALTLVLSDRTALPVIANAVVSEASETGASVTRVVLFDATERRRYERELLAQRERAERSESQARSLAKTLEASLLPQEIPSVRGLEIGAAYHPVTDASAVGGDFYDVFEHRDGSVFVAVGDVVGKGPRAAALTSLARHTIRSTALYRTAPSEILGAVADAFITYEPDDYCTIVLASIGPYPRRQVTIATGGHHLPLRCREDGSVQQIGALGSLLGMLRDPRISEVTVSMDPGDAVVVFTDGIVDALRGAERYGDERIARTFAAAASSDAHTIACDVARSALEFGEEPARDDIVVVSWKVTD